MSSVLGTGRSTNLIRENNLRANYESEPSIVINRAMTELSIDTKYCELSTLTENELCLDKESQKKSIMICTGNILKYITSRYMKYIVLGNKPICLYKTQNHANYYCKCKLSTDIEKKTQALLC